MSTNVLDDIDEQILERLRDYADVTITQIGQRMAWIHKKMIETSKEVSRIEEALIALDEQYKVKWEFAYETSVIESTKSQYSKFHEAVANRVVPEYKQIEAGLKSQRRVALNWLSTMKEIHEGLRTHSANIRGLGG